MILVNGAFQIHQNARDEMIPMLIETVAITQREPGCLVYKFTVDLEDPYLIHIVELWEDESALERHFQTPSFINTIAAMSARANVLYIDPRQGDLVPHHINMPNPSA